MNKLIYTLSLCFFCLLNTSLAQTVSISGIVLRHNGDPVEGVTVNCTNIPSVTSAADGSFEFTDLPEGGNYFITGVHETDVLENITILDLLFARQMLLGLPGVNFTAYQTFAGDMNNSGSYSTIDLVMISKAILQLDTPLPAVYWHFFDGASNLPMLLSGITLDNVTEDITGLELIATKKGDVAIDSDHMPPPPDVANPTYYIPDLDGLENEEIELEVRVNNFKEISGLQQDIQWDPGILELIDINSNDFIDMHINDAFAAEGHALIFASVQDDTLNMEFPDGSVLYSLKFKVLNSFETLDFVEFSEEKIPLQTVHRADDNMLYLLEDTYEVAVITSNNHPDNLQVFEILPNPAQHQIRVNIKFENTEKGELVLYDISGKMLETRNFETTGYQYQLNIEHLAKGTYVLKLRTEQGVIAKRFVKF